MVRGGSVGEVAALVRGGSIGEVVVVQVALAPLIGPTSGCTSLSDCCLIAV